MKTFTVRICLTMLLAIAFSAPAMAARLIAMNDDNGEFYEIDPSVPSATLLGDATLSVSLSGLSYDLVNDRLWVSDTCGDNCFGLGWVDMSTWQITEVGGFLSTSNIHAIAHDPDQDILFGWSTEQSQLVSIDRGTGAETYLGDSGGPAIVGMTYDPVNQRLLGVSRSDDTLYAIDTTTYAVTSIGALGVDAGSQFGLVWDPDVNRLFLGTGDGSFYELNPATGEATLLGGTGQLIGALAAVSGGGMVDELVAVPVNSTLALAMLTLAVLLTAGLVGFRRTV